MADLRVDSFPESRSVDEDGNRLLHRRVERGDGRHEVAAVAGPEPLQGGEDLGTMTRSRRPTIFRRASRASRCVSESACGSFGALPRRVEQLGGGHLVDERLEPDHGGLAVGLREQAPIGRNQLCHRHTEVAEGAGSVADDGARAILERPPQRRYRRLRGGAELPERGGGVGPDRARRVVEGLGQRRNGVGRTHLPEVPRGLRAHLRVPVLELLLQLQDLFRGALGLSHRKAERETRHQHEATPASKPPPADGKDHAERSASYAPEVPLRRRRHRIKASR